MKRNIFKALLIALALPLAFAMTSCEKNGLGERYVYLNTENQPLNKLEVSVQVEQYSTGVVKNVKGVTTLRFPAKSNQKANGNALCTFDYNPTELDHYNITNKDTARLLPAAYVNVGANRTLTIANGTNVSSDSLDISIVGLENLDVTHDYTYVYPLSIVKVSGGDFAVSTSRSTVYVVVKVSSGAVMCMTDQAGLTGTQIVRTSISMTGNTTPSRLNDGAATPSWRPQIQNATATFNLGKEKMITGFRTWPPYSYPTEGVKKLRIEVTTDEVNNTDTKWTILGYVELPDVEGTSVNPIWRYTKFQNPTAARYIRIRALTTYSTTPVRPTNRPDYNGYLTTGLSEVQWFEQ